MGRKMPRYPAAYHRIFYIQAPLPPPPPPPQQQQQNQSNAKQNLESIVCFPSPIWARNITIASHTQSIELLGVLQRPTMAIT